MNVTDMVTDDALRKQVEAKARADAEAGRYEEPYSEVSGIYQRRLILGAVNMVYALAHGKRAARLERMRAMNKLEKA